MWGTACKVEGITKSNELGLCDQADFSSRPRAGYSTCSLHQRWRSQLLSRTAAAAQFSKVADILNHKVLSMDPEQDPKVVNMAPK